MFTRTLKFLKSKNEKINRITEIERLLLSGLKSPKINLGQIQASLNNQKQHIDNLAEVEFQVFSQWGDDGIIQYLINRLDIPNKTFIEFGVENYTESNTRFLLVNNNWRGYVLDGSAENVEYIKNDGVSWACELYAECAFITKDNINDLIQKAGFEKEIGILSVDIDGNDYWVWNAIDCVNPVMVICEYNSVFGKNTTWTVPYDASFVRSAKHPSNLYYGVSLGALIGLAKQKGYVYVGCNSKGNNAYFIRAGKAGPIPARTLEEGYVCSKFREAHIHGKWISGKDRIKLLAGMEVYDTTQNAIIKIDPSHVEY